mmetsp:Transcript_30648/g.69170  ORF Transcript_30648/g.69170 Transcript_30648/m.69170 type:complete len:114 (+) Transcript_30648:721-1062(+)
MSFDPPRATKLFHKYSLTSAGNTTSSSPPACSRLSSKVCLDQRITQEEDEEEDEQVATSKRAPHGRQLELLQRIVKEMQLHKSLTAQANKKAAEAAQRPLEFPVPSSPTNNSS